jgi:Fe-S-cluster-containing dehydrogenase component
MKITKRITFVPHDCVGCGTCRLACAVSHSRSGDLVASLEETEPAAEPRLRCAPPGEAPGPADDSEIVLLHCRHCKDAPCVAACKPEAMTQCEETGLVVADRDACIGCKACIKKCPYDAVWMARGGEKAVVKCDLCVARLQEGEEPACASSCPTGALVFEEPGAEAGQDGPETTCVDVSKEDNP